MNRLTQPTQAETQLEVQAEVGPIQNFAERVLLRQTQSQLGGCSLSLSIYIYVYINTFLYMCVVIHNMYMYTYIHINTLSVEVLDVDPPVKFVPFWRGLFSRVHDGHRLRQRPQGSVQLSLESQECGLEELVLYFSPRSEAQGPGLAPQFFGPRPEAEPYIRYSNTNKPF